jgi:hypothetical protein
VSLKARIIIQDGLDGTVHLDRSIAFDSSKEDYRELPRLVRRLYDDTMEYVSQVGSYAIVKGFAPGSPADPDAPEV